MNNQAILVAESLDLDASSFAVSALFDDTELLQIGEEWRRCAKAEDAAYEEQAQINESYEEIPIPEALFWRHSDLGVFFGFMGERYYDGRPRGSRFWYGSNESLAFLRRWIFPDLELESIKAMTRLRISEILEAHQRWKDENTAIKEASGLTAAEAVSKRLKKQGRDLRAQIMALPAFTTRGLYLKARVFGWYRGQDASEIQKEAEEVADDEDVTDVMILKSLGADVLRMAEQQGAFGIASLPPN